MQARFDILQRKALDALQCPYNARKCRYNRAYTKSDFCRIARKSTTDDIKRIRARYNAF